MAKLLKNTTVSNIDLTDVGITILASSTYTSSPGEWYLLAQSTVLASQITASNIIVNDSYDDLDPTSGLRHIQGEGVPRDTSMSSASTVIATAANTITLVSGSRQTIIFTGSVAGQIIALPSALTCTVGNCFQFWNTTTTNISIKNFGGTLIYTLGPQTVATGILENKSTANGIWDFMATSLSSASAGGRVANFSFAQPGISAGAYLRIGGNASNFVGYIVPGVTNLVNITVSCQNAFTSTAVIQLQRRSAVGTLSDISGASITMAIGQYRGTTSLLIPIGADWEIAGYVKSGSTPGFSVITIFFAPS